MASFGDELRRERELRDISLKEISESTNIPIRFLEALEQNNFSILPGGAYTRGFIRSYAKHIGVNIEETVDAYQLERDRQDGARPGEPKRETEITIRAAEKPAKGGPAGLLVGSAVVIAGAIIGLIYWLGAANARTSSDGNETSAHVAALKAKVKKAGALPAAPIEPPAPASASVSGEVSPPSASPEGSAPAPAVERLVRVRALETTWVRLTCAGEVQFQGDLWVGSERHFPCREPMLLSAGNGGAIECSVDSAGLQFLGERGETVRDRALPILPPPAPEPPPARRTQPPSPAPSQPQGGEATAPQAPGAIS
jgi:cytoskeletal protein RodZ